MKRSKMILRYSLLIGAIYFLFISIAHFFEIKIPGLFIYFDVTSFEYQNKIISMLAFGWSTFFFLGYRIINTENYKLISLHIISGIIAIAILVVINLSVELKNLIGLESTIKYWIITIVLTLYLVWLTFFYIKSRKD